MERGRRRALNVGAGVIQERFVLPQPCEEVNRVTASECRAQADLPAPGEYPRQDNRGHRTAQRSPSRDPPQTLARDTPPANRNRLAAAENASNPPADRRSVYSTSGGPIA